MLELGYLPKLYYLMSWKRYSKKENILKLASTIYHFKKVIKLFYKKHLDKPIIIFKAVNIVLLMAKSNIKLNTKKKQNWSTNNINNKETKKNWNVSIDFYYILCFISISK